MSRSPKPPGIPGWVIREREDWEKVLRRDPCSYCGKPGGTVDHIDPMRKGVFTPWEGYTGACRDCNRKKTNVSLMEFLLWRAGALGSQEPKTRHAP